MDAVIVPRQTHVTIGVKESSNPLPRLAQSATESATMSTEQPKVNYIFWTRLEGHDDTETSSKSVDAMDLDAPATAGLYSKRSLSSRPVQAHVKFGHAACLSDRGDGNLSVDLLWGADEKGLTGESFTYNLSESLADFGRARVEVQVAHVQAKTGCYDRDSDNG